MLCWEKKCNGAWKTLSSEEGGPAAHLPKALRKMGGGADSPKASPKAASPRGDGKVAGFGELAQEEEAQAQDRLAVATKMGAEREALSAARDLSKAKAKLAALQQQMEAKEKAMMLQKDKMSKQELALFKLGKEHEREQSEHRKCSKLCNNRGDELAQLKKKYSADMSTEQDRTKDALQKCDDLENAMAAVEKQLGAATGSLRSAHNAMERLNKSEENANQKMLLMRDTVVKQEADIRDLTSRLRIETNEHMKSEERGGKYQAEIKLQKQRLEAEQIRAGQCMSSLATVKSELAVALEANAAQGMTPAIVLENDQLKLDREGFMTQIRGLTDTISRLEMTSNNALRSLEKEKSEHVRFQMLYKEKTEELNKHKKMMQSMKEANRESTAQLDGKVMEMNAEVKEMTRVQAGTEGDLRVKSTQATNLQAECAQLQKRIVSLKDTQTQNLTRINTLEDDLNRENRLRIRMETELSLMTEKQKRTKDQAASDTRSFTLQKEEMTRELTESQSECTRLLAQLDKEKKAAAQASQLKNKAGDDQSKAVQKAQEHRERFEKAQIALAEAQQSLHEEQTLRVGQFSATTATHCLPLVPSADCADAAGLRGGEVQQEELRAERAADPQAPGVREGPLPHEDRADEIGDRTQDGERGARSVPGSEGGGDAEAAGEGQQPTRLQRHADTHAPLPAARDDERQRPDPDPEPRCAAAALGPVAAGAPRPPPDCVRRHGLAQRRARIPGRLRALESVPQGDRAALGARGGARLWLSWDWLLRPCRRALRGLGAVARAAAPRWRLSRVF
eukprot:COSAG04_NODE_748_length_10610_cov_13.629436_5_plen_794_part_00